MSMGIRSCRPDELEQLIFLLDKEFIFGKGRVISLRLRFPTLFCRNNLHNIILCTDGEEIVSALAMRQFNWCENDKIFRGAMIGMVYTHPARRREGLASRLLTEAAMRLREGEMDFGVLWTGQQSFYAHLGWMAADCGVLGEICLGDQQIGDAGEVACMPAQAGVQEMECIRQRYLNLKTLRGTENYLSIPLPATTANVLWKKDQDKTAYALVGSGGEMGFLYELVGNPDNFAALWQETRRNQRQILVNDYVGSSSYCWLTAHTGINWKSKALAMWLPVSKRVTMSHFGRWYIPYFDRI